MGGNSALRDCDQALKMLTRLASFASSSGGLESEAIIRACKDYEEEMMPRAFGWVKASGGENMVVSTLDLSFVARPRTDGEQPIDASTIMGRMIFTFGAIAMQIASYFYAFTGMFVDRKFVDDAPELR